MTSPGILLIDTRAGSYPDIRLPYNWRAIRLPLDMAVACEMVFQMLPNEDHYGWLADDLRPRTQDVDKKMEAATRGWRLVDCHDLYLAEQESLRAGSLCGAFVWGGKLVRAVGYWAIPGIQQAGMDDSWVDLAAKNQPLRYWMSDVVVEHLQYRNDKREKDETDNWERNGEAYIERDFARLAVWRNNGELQQACGRIQAAMEAEGVTIHDIWR